MGVRGRGAYSASRRLQGQGRVYTRLLRKGAGACDKAFASFSCYEYMDAPAKTRIVDTIGTDDVRARHQCLVL